MSCTEKNLYYSLLPLLYTSKIFGLSSFSLKGHDGSRRPVCSYISRIYSFSIIIVYFIGILIFFWRHKFIDHVASSEAFLSKTGELFQMTFSCLCFVLMIVFACRNNHQLRILADIVHADILSRGTLDFSDDSHRKFRKHVNTLILVLGF